ncbi:MAG: glycosyltransferase [Bacteroidales bacterium]|nr:glycosyltransferase [Bacteroidales bacterium]
MKKVFLFTHSFPFTEVGESFIEVELKIVSLLNVDLSIIPLYSLSTPKAIPEKIKIIPDLFNTSFFRKIVIFFSVFINPMFYGLFIYKKSIYKKPGNWYNAIKYLYGGLLVKDFLVRNKTLFPPDSIFLSFWFNYTALGFALAKEVIHFKSCKFYSRAHRYDLYGEEAGIFIPYRERMLSALDMIYPGSDDGVRFLTKNYPAYSSKIELARLGVMPISMNGRIRKKSDISLISCSNIVPVKRVDLIFTSINKFCENNSEFNVSWLHIGNGVEMKNLGEQVTKEKVSNLTVSLPGYKHISEIEDILGKNEFDAFLNFSSSEGLPVTLMMAISAGIPVIATDAGGNKEIVKKETGRLLSLSISQAEFSDAVLFCRDNYKLRESALLYYHNNFSAINNYTNFYEKL